MLYCEKIPIKINQNPGSNVMLAVEGRGTEPKVEFSHHLLEFPPTMPFGDNSEAEVTISNPKDYPVEIYSLEFDKQYLEEEEVRNIVSLFGWLFFTSNGSQTNVLLLFLSDVKVGQGL